MERFWGLEKKIGNDGKEGGRGGNIVYNVVDTLGV